MDAIQIVALPILGFQHKHGLKPCQPIQTTAMHFNSIAIGVGKAVISTVVRHG